MLWDKKRSLGVSVIESIETGEDDKILRRCPNPKCLKAGIKARRTIQPLYKCYKCGEQFDDPVTRIERVKTYKSRHDGGWVDLEDVLTGDELRKLAVAPKSQLSLRPLNWAAFESTLASKGRLLSTPPAAKRLTDPPDGRHPEATVRVRVGQAKFRKALLYRQGLRCGFTGDAPHAVLDACHLYSFAAIGVHDPLLYPWDPPVASGVMDGKEFRPLEHSAGLDEALAQASAAPLEARSLVVSIGPNSSADVMRRKFANYHQPVSAVLPLVRGSSTTSPVATPPT